MFDTIQNFRYVWDTLDIALVAFIIYYALTMIEGTRALKSYLAWFYYSLFSIYLKRVYLL